MKVSKSDEIRNLDLDELTNRITELHNKIVNDEDFTEEFFRKNFTQEKTLTQIWERLVKDFNLHIYKEENILFPYLINLAKSLRNEIPFEQPYFLNVKSPIEIMKSDHEIIVEMIDELKNFLNNFTAEEKKEKKPLSKFESILAEIEEVVYLETEILFPKAIDAERLLLNHN